MRLENNRIVLETRECDSCDGIGKRKKFSPCPRYNQKVSHLRGRQCDICGAKNKHSHQHFEDAVASECNWCGGVGSKAEDAGDHMPSEIWQALEFRVFRSDRPITYNESLLGMGCVYSSQDYGEYKRLTDEQLIALVKQTTSHQACKITRSWEDLEVCTFVGIFCNNSGYSVRAVFPDKIPNIANETTYAEGMAKGIAIAGQGGNGTIGGAFRK